MFLFEDNGVPRRIMIKTIAETIIKYAVYESQNLPALAKPREKLIIGNNWKGNNAPEIQENILHQADEDRHC
jgi:hypothetical protein